MSVGGDRPTCACPRSRARDCFEARYGGITTEEPESVCECPCHEEHERAEVDADGEDEPDPFRELTIAAGAPGSSAANPMLLAPPEWNPETCAMPYGFLVTRSTVTFDCYAKRGGDQWRCETCAIGRSLDAALGK